MVCVCCAVGSVPAVSRRDTSALLLTRCWMERKTKRKILNLRWQKKGVPGITSPLVLVITEYCTTLTIKLMDLGDS